MKLSINHNDNHLATVEFTNPAQAVRMGRWICLECDELWYETDEPKVIGDWKRADAVGPNRLWQRVY